MQVEVLEAELLPGGGARTMELTLPGFHHDFGSAVHPMAAGSPFFSSLPLGAHGLEWIHPSAPLAHPFDDGSAITLEHDLMEAVRVLGPDGNGWRDLVAPLVEHWTEFASAILRPLLQFPRHPILLANFGLNALPSALTVAKRRFRSERARALFAGLAAHSFLALDEPLSASYAIVLGAAAHAVGWPIPRGGAQSITRALIAHLEQLGGIVKISNRVNSLDSVGDFDAALCDVTPHQLQRMAADHFTPSYNRQLGLYRYGPGVFKVDFALSDPIPWRAADCSRAATVHLGGTMNAIASSEDSMRRGRHAERPFVLLAQPTLFDSSRCPTGKHIAWAYCHVPNGSTFDMLSRLEDQIERFAPGFRDCILARRVFKPADLEAMDRNLRGGDIVGGAADWRQFLFRPTWRHYATSNRRIYICSSSTPPGGGVHGMCGYNAATLALSRLPG
jgi:phytoene dehydrogenase-like protein